MDESVLGIPYFALGLGCLGLAVVWCYVWPKDRTPESIKNLPEYQPRPAWAQAVLRWFHALVWVLLAALFFFLDAGLQPLASMSGLMAGIMYLTFVMALVKDRRRQKALERASASPAATRQSGR